MSPETFNTKRTQKGFTLVELLIAIGISLVLAAAAGAPVYGNLQGASQIQDSTAQIVQTIRIARERSVAGVNNARHGVYFESVDNGEDLVTLYQGSSYALRDSVYDRVMAIPEALAITTTMGNDVNFSREGIPNAAGSLTLTHRVRGSSTLGLNAWGVVSVE